MARPLQTGLTYFPLDVSIDQDDKIALIESDFGLEGFAVTIKLMMGLRNI
ncbi:Lin1244/Lin1753 domain-containing protein [Alkalibacterium putridalgicola]